jgi:hypothetical protein
VIWRRLHLDWRYALGEFSIVVLGVLAALWVGNWNADREDRVLEREYVQSLLGDLRADAASFSSTLNRTEELANYISVVLDSIASHDIAVSPKDFVIAANSLSRMTFPAESRSTINDLMSTGNLRLIESREIRSAIADYYTKLDWNAQWREIWRSYQLSMGSIMPELVDVRFREAFIYEANRIPWVTVDIEVSASDAEAILRRLSDHPKALTTIANMKRTQGLNYEYVLNSKDGVESLIPIIENYLEEL